ncbi:MAG: hypothetical protein P4L81_03970 [Candidatus Pacebacteria bacterium]|nr:hypothetical protein [Candidatus Paceibacterota bacterium]
MKVRNLKRTRRSHVDSKIDRNAGARLLFVSGSHLDALVRSGKVIPTSFGPTGPHRFLKAALLSYKKKQKKRQRKGLKKMMAASERMGLYDAEIADLQTRKPGAP